MAEPQTSATPPPAPPPAPLPSPPPDGPATNRRARLGWILLVIVAAATVVLPVLLDGVVLAGAHMQNPAWLPHAKLHTAISFLAAIALGGGALVCLLARPVTDGFTMAMGGYLAGAFWIALIAAGAWPGTSYYFAGDPVYGGNDPQILGVPNNVATALLMIAVVVIGLLLVLGPDDRRGTRRRPVVEGTPHPPGPIIVSEIDRLAGRPERGRL